MPDPRHERLVERYGFGLFPIPRYREIRGKTWSMLLHRPGMGDGYCTGPLIEAPKFVLYQGRTAWMSTGLMELESHAPHVDAAKGVVVVAGFGMGLYTYAIAQKPDVTKIVVIEKDDSLIALLQDQGVFDTWPHWDKVTVLVGDALAPDLGERVAAVTEGAVPDYLYADIWPVCPHEAAADETRRMVANLQPKRAGWWGQELSFGLWCGQQDRRPDGTSLAEFFQDWAVPWGQPTMGYVQFCDDVLKLNPGVFKRQPAKSNGFWASVRKLFLPNA